MLLYVLLLEFLDGPVELYLFLEQLRDFDFPIVFDHLVHVLALMGLRFGHHRADVLGVSIAEVGFETESQVLYLL